MTPPDGVGDPSAGDADAQEARTVRHAAGRVLLAGLALSMALLLLGLVLLGAGGALASTLPTLPAVPPPATASGVGTLLLFAGVLVLVLTPVLRVAASAVLFARARDGWFTLITLVVLVLLVATAASGFYR
jgi:uncharacterized membrane protein